MGNNWARSWTDEVSGISLVGSTVSSQGGNIFLRGLSHDTGDDDGVNYGFNIENSTISSQAGNIQLSGDIRGRYLRGMGLRIVSSTSATSITSTTGAIEINGSGYDQTTNGNSWRSAVLIISNSTSSQTTIS
ncbi:MAG: hypothetical protein ACK53L_28255, partial [Pirellulaceae bacterium]